MLNAAQANRAHSLVAILVSCWLGVFAPTPAIAQTPAGVIPITSEPDHKIRFDSGKVRVYEVVLPKGKTTLVHEHRNDSFTVYFSNGEVTNEPYGGKPIVVNRTAGTVAFTSTANGPYSHRVIASGETTFHVMALELMSPANTSAVTASLRPSAMFKVALESPRGRAYRATLAPGASTEIFTRPARSMFFAISAGRISETIDGKPARLWDFEPAYIRWSETSEKLSIKNESSTPIDFVEIEVF